MPNYLITGGAGFIGSHLAGSLLSEPEARVYCLDNFESFYPRIVKEKNISAFMELPNFRLLEGDISDAAALEAILNSIPIPDAIVHLAAKAGVRPSIQDPASYYETNVNGTINLLEFARRKGIKPFIFASSSSVYGMNASVPWKENDRNLLPISPYASSKIAAEHLGRVYSHLYGIHFTALRLFTVYGSRQRPDLAIHKFLRAMEAGSPVTLFGDGSTYRDYTHVSDIVKGIRLALKQAAEGFRIYNLGSGNPVSLLGLVNELEKVSGLNARVEFLEKQAGDVDGTFADISKAVNELGYAPEMSINQGLSEFWTWKKAST
jgi:UDP-glucuronate 4-epimerase